MKRDGGDENKDAVASAGCFAFIFMLAMVATALLGRCAWGAP